MSSEASANACVLIVDDSDIFRDSMQWQLRQIGCDAIVASTYGRALKLFEQNGDVNIVVLDHLTIGSDVAKVVGAFKAIRTDAHIVGNSGGDRRAEFAAAGVDHYLQKPWRAAELLAIWRRGIGDCVECGTRLPLRHPNPGEVGESWACAFCGARYRAVMDESASPEVRSNARLVASPGS